MAGRPRSREKRERAAREAAEQATVAQPVQVSGVESLTQRTPARAPTRASAREAPTVLKHTATGSHTRVALDVQEAADVAGMQAHLKPRHFVRITRTKPQWAYGWLEDYALQRANIGELLEYLRDEHGGQFYKLEVLSRDGLTVLYTAEQPIAGAVKRAGKVCSRDQWEGNEERPHTTVQQVQPTAAPFGFNPLDLVTQLISLSDKSTKATADLVDKMHSNTRELLETALETKADVNKPASLGEQLNQFVQLTDTVDRARTKLGRSKEAPAKPAETTDPIKAAMGGILVEAFKNDQARSQQRPPVQQVRPVRRPAVQQPPPPPSSGAAAATNASGVERLTRTQH